MKKRVESFLTTRHASFSNGAISFSEDPILAANLSGLQICDVELDSRVTGGAVPVWQSELRVHVVQLDTEGAVDESDEEVTSCQIWMLPSKDFHGLWESLIYDFDVKRNLLDYAQTAMFFSDRRVDPNIITWNRVVLLHGPPGTGKTSLCKALAHKLSIRMSDRYRSGQLVEVNAHSLFSKWFSESGKLVNKLFDTIREFLDDEETFVCVLIDEVESLTAARQSALNGSEPSDAIRVVNALLTQIDKLKERQNCLVMTTTNITAAIDLAFVDRADIKQFIGHPSTPAIYQILRSCTVELMRVGIVAPQEELKDVSLLTSQPAAAAGSPDSSVRLYHCASEAQGFSGRFLRKLPFLAHSMFLRRKSASMPMFCDALLKAIHAEKSARSHEAINQK
uniref:AAA+ ATPase domain-containing protein n=1 Tax=Hanusia phi TaxID=3032 RepID=A0A7S0EB03_9CRYP